MQDKNETDALIRRLGGQTRVANALGLTRQAVFRWIEHDRISKNFVPEMLRLCLEDRLPVLQTQIRTVWERRLAARRKLKMNAR